MSDSHVMPECQCPVCSYVIDRAATVNGDTPPPGKGDFSVCFNCACILVFDTCDECDDLLVRLPVIEEAMELETLHPEVAAQLAQHQKAIFDLRAREDPAWTPEWMPRPN